MDLKNYEKILSVKTVGEAFAQDTVNIINNDFQNSPSYKNALVNGVEEDILLKFTKNFNKREIFFRPLKMFAKGTYVELDGKTYMVMEFIPNPIYPKAQITMCNDTLRWKGSDDSIIEYRCVIEGVGLSIDSDKPTDNERFITKSDGELDVYIPYNSDTKGIEVEQRFIFDGSAYDVLSIDKLTNVIDGQGIIKLTIKSTLKTDSDNIEDGVADDSSNSGWSGW